MTLLQRTNKIFIQYEPIPRGKGKEGGERREEERKREVGFKGIKTHIKRKYSDGCSCTMRPTGSEAASYGGRLTLEWLGCWILGVLAGGE